MDISFRLEMKRVSNSEHRKTLIDGRMNAPLGAQFSAVLISSIPGAIRGR